MSQLSHKSPPPATGDDPQTGRPSFFERSDYQRFASTERFIVPLLRNSIQQALEKHHLLQPAAGAKVLDVGCGRQPLRKQLESGGYSYFGLDAAQNAEGTVNFVGLIDAQVLPEDLSAAGTFDLLICTEVLEHVAHWDRAFSNMSQLMKPGGALLITCPHIFNLHEEPYDFWRPTTYAIEHFARISHLEILELQRAGSPLDALGTVLAGFRPTRRPGKALSGLWAFLANKSRQAALAILATRFLQNRVDVVGKFYLSNVAVLRRLEKGTL